MQIRPDKVQSAGSCTLQYRSFWFHVFSFFPHWFSRLAAIHHTFKSYYKNFILKILIKNSKWYVLRRICIIKLPKLPSSLTNVNSVSHKLLLYYQNDVMKLSKYSINHDMKPNKRVNVCHGPSNEYKTGIFPTKKWYQCVQTDSSDS